MKDHIQQRTSRAANALSTVAVLILGMLSVASMFATAGSFYMFFRGDLGSPWPIATWGSVALLCYAAFRFAVWRAMR